MDNVLKTEVLLNFLNTLLAKAVHFKDEALIKKLSTLRHQVYYSKDFDHEKSLSILKEINMDLNKYE